MAYCMDKVAGRITEKFDTQLAFSKHIGRTPAFVSKVLKGKSILTQDDIGIWAENLEIEPVDIGVYFFRKKVHETEHEGER